MLKLKLIVECNMKVKVFQLQQKRSDSEGNIIPKDKRKNKIVCIGTVIVPKNKKDFVEEAIWDLFNWSGDCERDTQ